MIEGRGEDNNMKKRTVLVTGGAGFIGSHVAEAFLNEGYDVSVIDNLSSGTLDNLPAGVLLHICDIRSQEAADIVFENRFDVICHLAAQTEVQKSVADSAYDASINISGSLNLLEAVRASGKNTRFIFSS